MPKIYFYDTGLAAYLTRIRSEDLFEHGPMKGQLFENFIVSEVLKRELHHQRNSELSYYRTSHGVEVDLVIDRFTHKELIEIKSLSTFKPRMIKPMQNLIEGNDIGFLVYRGNGVAHAKRECQNKCVNVNN